MTDKVDLPMALRSAYLTMHRQSDVVFRRFGVTADQFVLLATLSRGQALTQRDLASRMTSDPSTVRAMLVLLEKQGLIVRDVHPQDSRARTVSLSRRWQTQVPENSGRPVSRCGRRCLIRCDLRVLRCWSSCCGS